MQTQDIKRRIKSVKSTQQITKAMKFVAAAKLRRSQERMLAMRPYADALDGLVKHLARDLMGDEHPLFRKPEDPRRAAYIVIAGDRGLCGGFNTTILKAASEFARSRPKVEPVFFAVGKQAGAALRKTGGRVIKSYHDVFEKLSYVLAGSICDQLVAMTVSRDPEERIDEAYLVYSEFVTMLTQKPVVKKLIPVDYRAFLPEPDDQGKLAEEVTLADGEILEEVVLEESPDDVFDEGDIEEEILTEKGEAEAAATKGPPRPIYELLPNPATALEKLIARRMATEVYRGTLESYAAELAARMTAMDNATANADEMIASLTLSYNQARQFGITSELLDIIGGANALG